MGYLYFYGDTCCALMNNADKKMFLRNILKQRELEDKYLYIEGQYIKERYVKLADHNENLDSNMAEGGSHNIDDIVLVKITNTNSDKLKLIQGINYFNHLLIFDKDTLIFECYDFFFNNAEAKILKRYFHVFEKFL